MFLPQLFDGPIDPLGVGHLLLLVIWNGPPLEEESAGYFLPLVVDAVRKRIGKRNLLAKGVEGPTRFALRFVAQKKLAPSTLVNVTGRMVKELPRSQGGVTRLGKAHLQGLDLRVMHKIIGTRITTGRRRELP